MCGTSHVFEFSSLDAPMMPQRRHVLSTRLPCGLYALHKFHSPPTIITSKCCYSTSDCNPRLQTLRLWQSYIKDPSQWLDNRSNKTNPSMPDFRHKLTNQMLWIDSPYNPRWVNYMLQTSDPEKCESKEIDESPHPQEFSTASKMPLGKLHLSLSELSQMQDTPTLEKLSLTEMVQALDGMAEPPSKDSLICLLQKCRKAQNLKTAKHLHAYICMNGLEDDRIIGNYIVPMFIECGSVADAQQVFDRLAYRNEHSWTSLILGYIQSKQSDHALNLYEKMQEDNVSPSSYTLIALLRACAVLKDVARGRAIHVQIAQKGFDRSLYVGNALVNMYAKCGSLSEAQEAFDKLPIRDVVSWNALISGYADCGHGQEVLKCLKQMQLEGISPTVVTYAYGLKACGKIGAKNKGREIHAEIIQKGYERDLFLTNTLIHMYAKCGSLSEAQKVFDMLSVRDVVSWTTLIAGYTEHGCVQEALKFFEQMQQEGISPNAFTFVCALKVCSSLKDIDKGQKIHREIIQNGFESDLFVASTLVDMYARCGLPSVAQEVFDKLRVRDCVSWNALISGYAEHGLGQNALRCFKQMQHEGISPSPITFVGILKACGSMKATDKGRDLHTKIIEYGFERDLIVGNALVDMYGKCGSLSEAWDAFSKLPVRNVGSWNALIAGYVKHGLGAKALECFEQMQLEGVSPGAVTFVCVLKACGKIGAIEKGQAIHRIIAQQGFDGDPFVGNTLVDMYAKCGVLSKAREVFDKLQVQDNVSWNALIGGYAEHGSAQEALNCFDRMQLHGVNPNTVTFCFGLKACGRIGAINKGRQLHLDIKHKGFEKHLPVGNALIDMYAKCGLFLEARCIFDNLPARDVVSWDSMINGYGMNYEGNMAVKCFEDMVKQGQEPNAITFACLLTACSLSGLIFKGKTFLKMMIQDYGIVPTVDHYTCMIELLARSGHLREAEKFLEDLPCHPSKSTWIVLLTACKSYGEIELGSRCFRQLVQVNPKSIDPYMVMASIYASTGRMDEAYSIDKLRKDARARRRPISAMIEVNKKVYEFPLCNNQDEKIMALLKNSSVKGAGEMSILDLLTRPISEKDKSFCEHAEKIALAFGIINTKKGERLCVTKNVRMCNYCHNATKFISRVEKREIIVRDGYSIHHFTDGTCSCRDML